MFRIEKNSVIVIIQTAFIGDTALALYFANYIKEIEHDVKIVFVCAPSAESIISNTKFIDECIVYDKRSSNNGLGGIKAIAKQINNYNPNILFCLHRSLRSSILSFLIKAKLKVGFENSAIKYAYNIREKYYSNLHEIDRNNELLNRFTQNLKYEFPEYLEIEPSQKKIVEETRKYCLGRKCVIISPGSVWNTKKWKSESFKLLCERFLAFGYGVIVSGSKSEIELCEYVAGGKAFNIAGRVDLHDTITINKMCAVAIANDSAPTHLASIAGIPTVTLYGATSPLFGFYPKGKDSISMQFENLECNPCLIHGSNECPINSWQCIEKLEVDKVFEAAQEILSKTFSKPIF
jgi:heptosyltransferase-2